MIHIELVTPSQENFIPMHKTRSFSLFLKFLSRHKKYLRNSLAFYDKVDMSVVYFISLRYSM
jgi:hypothetical protein